MPEECPGIVQKVHFIMNHKIQNKHHSICTGSVGNPTIGELDDAPECLF